MRTHNSVIAGLAAAALLAAPVAMTVSATAAPPVATSVAGKWLQLGSWDKHKTYHYGNIVKYKGKSYVAIRKNKNHKPRGSKLWRVVAVNGGTGTTGRAGTTGANGATGATGPVGPNWVVKDKAGTTLGVYAGLSPMAVRWSDYPAFYVLFEGGIWGYLMEGGYSPQAAQTEAEVGSAASLLPSVEAATPRRYFSSPAFTSDQCTGTPFTVAPTQEAAQVLAALSTSSLRTVGELSTGILVGYKPGTVIQDNRGPDETLLLPLYAWSPTPPDGARSCRAISTDYRWLVELTQVPLPPASVGWPTVVAP